MSHAYCHPKPTAPAKTPLAVNRRIQNAVTTHIARMSVRVVLFLAQMNLKPNTQYTRTTINITLQMDARPVACQMSAPIPHITIQEVTMMCSRTDTLPGMATCTRLISP